MELTIKQEHAEILNLKLNSMKTAQTSLISFLLCLPSFVFGGGIVTNTNQSASWVRMFARDASRDLDAVYYNPAGLTGLGKGYFFSLNNQSIFQKKSIDNNYPYLNSSEYNGNVSAPLFPSFYAAYSTGKFVFSAGFNPIGGGGSATFNRGLPSFEIGISDLVPALSSKGVTKYSSDVYFKGTSIFWGGQAGVSYKINDIISIYAGGRYVSASNTYQGHLTNNTIYFGSTAMPASTFFTNVATQATSGANGLQPLIAGGAGSLTLAQAQGAGAITAQQRAAIEGGLTALGIPITLPIQQTQAAFNTAATGYTNKAFLLSDQEADVTQTGTGFTPIIGLNLNLLESKLNIGLKYEFITKLTLQNNTKKDITTGFNTDGSSITQFPDKAKTASDMPAMLSVGASYKLFNNFRLAAGLHYYFDKAADYGRSLNGVVVENKTVINKNYYEIALGMEYDITEKIMLSAGYLLAQTGVMVGYNTDLSYSLTSNSVGFGGKIAVSPKLDVNLGIAYSFYNNGEKELTHTIAGSTTPVSFKESYYKDNLIFSIGFDIKFGK